MDVKSMSTIIQIKRHLGPLSKVPAPGSLRQGELAVDLAAGPGRALLYVGTGTNTSDVPILLNGAESPPIATNTRLGVVIAGLGLKIDTNGKLSAAVLTVNGKGPDNAGNIKLVPSDIGALAVDGTAQRADVATKLATPRSIVISDGATSVPVSFDGTNNVNLKVTNVRHSAVDSVNHNPSKTQFMLGTGWVNDEDLVISGGTF